MPDLFLRPTEMNGELLKDDYVVIWHGLSIGRIFKGIDVGGGHAWSWSCFLPNVPQTSSHRGRAGSLAQAKVAFRTAWEDLQGQISHGEIEEARRLLNKIVKK